MNYFIINAKLPSLNDYINVCRTNKYKAAQFKREVEEEIGWAIKKARAEGTLRPVKKPCVLTFEWYEKTIRRDCDNIASAKKFILDAMQTYGVIVNDSQQYIKGFADYFFHADKTYVKVTLYEWE